MPPKPRAGPLSVAGSSATLTRASRAGFSGKILIVLAASGYAETMSSKMAHTTEFPLANDPTLRPLEVIRLLVKGGLPPTMARSVVERIAAKNIKGRYYHETNRVYIEIGPEPSAQTREVSNGLKVGLDGDGNIVGFDIDNASRLGALLRDFIASGALVADLARAWASLDDTRGEFDKEKGSSASEAAPSDYLGYLAEIEEILELATNAKKNASAER